MDVVETARQEKALKREMLENKRREEMERKEAAREEELFKRQVDYEKEQEIFLQEWEENETEVPELNDTSSYNWINLQNRDHFPRTVLAAMRGGVSKRTLANILSSYAVDMGLATNEDPSLLVHQAKVSRE